MKLLIYVGLAPSRSGVIAFSVPLIQKVASSVTLVTGGGEENGQLLQDALQQLAVPLGMTVELRALNGDAQAAILGAAREQPYDLVIVGRLHQPLRRLLPGPHSKAIAQRLEPSVLRFHGAVRPIQRILLASGGDHHTFDDVHMTARLAVPLGASVTLLHVLSQQSLVFEGFPARHVTVDDFLSRPSLEANTLRDAAAMLHERGVSAQIKGRAGPVIDQILTEIREGDYDLLVLGAHRVGGALDRILLEDITGDLLDMSALPVLVVKRSPEV